MTISNVLAFDIETVPDVEFGRRAHGLDGLSDKQIGYVMQTRQRELTGSEFLSLEQQRIVAISVAMRTRDGFRSWSLGEPESDERDLVRRFFDGLDRYSPTIVSWNGNGFDLHATQAELGDALGLSTVHVNRVLQDLRKDGLIALRGKRLTILEWNELKRAGEFDPLYLHLKSADLAE